MWQLQRWSSLTPHHSISSQLSLCLLRIPWMSPPYIEGGSDPFPHICHQNYDLSSTLFIDSQRNPFHFLNEDYPHDWKSTPCSPGFRRTHPKHPQASKEEDLCFCHIYLGNKKTPPACKHAQLMILLGLLIALVSHMRWI